MRKDIDYYLKLPYTIEIVPVPEKEGGGYMARLPQVGRFAIVGDGETIQEALQNLEESKNERFMEYLKEGVEIPEPDADDEQFSGRFVVKVPKCLHLELALGAKRNGVTFNEYITYLLSANFHLDPSRKDETLVAEIRSLEQEAQEHTRPEASSSKKSRQRMPRILEKEKKPKE